MNSDIEIDISYDYWGVLVLVIKSINYYVTGNFSRRNSLIWLYNKNGGVCSQLSVHPLSSL